MNASVIDDQNDRGGGRTQDLIGNVGQVWLNMRDRVKQLEK